MISNMSTFDKYVAVTTTVHTNYVQTTVRFQWGECTYKEYGFGHLSIPRAIFNAADELEVCERYAPSPLDEKLDGFPENTYIRISYMFGRDRRYKVTEARYGGPDGSFDLIRAFASSVPDVVKEKVLANFVDKIDAGDAEGLLTIVRALKVASGSKSLKE